MSDKCFHCGQPIEKERVSFDEKLFCCLGCKSVFEILQLHQLNDFYEYNQRSGIKPNDDHTTQFDYLDTPEVFDKLVDYSEGEYTLVTFKIPVIHCTSCIWLLESLHKISPAIGHSQVNFTKKTVQITFDKEQMPLSELAKFLNNLGYKPVINLESSDQKEEYIDQSLLIKIAIAGFAFGNGMFFSYPEYAMEVLGTSDIWMEKYKGLFRLIMFALATPVVLYSASDYFRSAWMGLKNKIINIDVPIVLGILVLYFRSIYEVTTDYGPGYFDTLCGLVFFMLLGKYFQKRTYHSLSYDRDYKSFYPIAVTILDEKGEASNVLLSELKVGDRILVRNQEIIPVDSILIKGEGQIDNSFITGESRTIAKEPGDKIFAGGKQVGPILELEVIKNVDQSYLTQLWNKEAFKKNTVNVDTITNSISKYFTFAVLGLTLLGGIYWYATDVTKVFQVITAVLIVACPCALALSAPFTFGHMMRIMGKNGFYVKDGSTIERLSKVDTLVFDKTGTLTHQKGSKIKYEGKELSNHDVQLLKSLVRNSNHPLSRSLYDSIDIKDGNFLVEDFKEISGKGYQGSVNGQSFKVGSASFVGQKSVENETAIYIEKNGEFLGKFMVENEYRNGLEKVFHSLKNYAIHVLSGDNNAELQNIKKIIPTLTNAAFNQNPEGKMQYIKSLQKKGEVVAMLGDGLNDAGALKQSDVGIAVADDSNSFTPSSDVIISGKEVTNLNDYLYLSKKTISIIKIMFVISIFYNITGISIALLGKMTPLVAAILMPISSITIVSLTTLLTWWVGREIVAKQSRINKN